MERYEIRVTGHLESRRARSLGCSDVQTLDSGESVLGFDAADQSALYGLLARLRDLGVALVGLRKCTNSIDGPEADR